MYPTDLYFCCRNVILQLVGFCQVIALWRCGFMKDVFGGCLADHTWKVFSLLLWFQKTTSVADFINRTDFAGVE